MKIAIAQLNSNDNMNENLRAISDLILQAKPQKPEIIFFPENSLFFRIQNETEIKALTLEDQIFHQLSKMVNETDIAVHLTTAIQDYDLKTYNASILICPQQKPKVTYRKIHLFDISLDGQKAQRESDCFVRGRQENIFEFKEFRFGSSICYDLRFSELYNKYAVQEVDVILIPAAFLVKTGQAHWEVLVRARAIESQCYVLAPAQAGQHSSPFSEARRETFGHSMIVSPWGEVMGLLKAETGLIYCDLQKNLIESVRRQIPMKNHRRL